MVPGIQLGDVLSVTIIGAEYPVNLGYAARLMKNFGLRRMYLVDPHCDMRAASVYASHGAEILDGAKLAKFSYVRRIHDILLATTAVRARRKANVSRTVTRPEEAIARVVAAPSASIVFGRDTTGLTNQELALCDLVTSLDTKTEYKSLNVSHSAAILFYLASKAWTAERLAREKYESQMATRESREAFAEYAHRLAIATGMQGHKAKRMVQVALRVALKSDVSSKDIGLLVSLMRRAEVEVKKAPTTRSAQGRTEIS